MTLYIVILLHRRDYADPEITVFDYWFEAYQFALDKVLSLTLDYSVKGFLCVNLANKTQVNYCNCNICKHSKINTALAIPPPPLYYATITA